MSLKEPAQDKQMSTADVDVGHDAEPEVGLAVPAEVRRTDETEPAERTERRRSADEEPPRHLQRMMTDMPSGVAPK